MEILGQSTNHGQEVSLRACSGSTSESVSHKNKEIQDQTEDKSIEGYEKELDDLQSFEKKLKKKMKKNLEIKLVDLGNDLLQEEVFFLKLLKDF